MNEHFNSLWHGFLPPLVGKLAGIKYHSVCMRIQASVVNKNVSCKQAKRQKILPTNFEGLVRTIKIL